MLAHDNVGLHVNGHTFCFTNHNNRKGVAKGSSEYEKAVYSSRTDGKTYQSFLLMTLGLSVQYGMLRILFMTRHERFNRFVGDFVDEAGTLAVGIAERDGEFDHRERRFTSTDDVGVTVNGGNDESKVFFQR